MDPCYASWAAFLDRLWEGPASTPEVLDVCCGTGLLAAELATLGYRVVGADASAPMLAQARERLGPGAELHRADLPDVGTTATFDAAVSSFDGLNYLPPDAFTTTVAALARRLRPDGGWLVFDLHTDAMMTFTAEHPVVSGEEDGTRYRITSATDAAARTCATTIEFIPPGGQGFTETHDQYFHSDQHVRAALDAAGFQVVAILDEYSDRAADAGTLRATWVARRR